MEVVNFSTTLFHDIPRQDNPAFGNVECIMITKGYRYQKMISVLHIIPVENPTENESVTTICKCFTVENAIKIANMLVSTSLISETDEIIKLLGIYQDKYDYDLLRLELYSDYSGNIIETSSVNILFSFNNKAELVSELEN